MILSDDELNILNRLVGSMDENTAIAMKEKIDFFLHPKVSLFIPASGQCKYAVMQNHTHPAYSFIYYFESVSGLIVEGENISHDISDGKCLSAMSPDIPHQEPEQEGFQSYIAILIDAEFFRKTLLQYTPSVPVFRGNSFSPHPELLGLLKCFMLESGEFEHRNSEYLEQLALAIVHLTARSVVFSTFETAPLYNRFEVNRAIAYMNSRFSDRITAEELAYYVNISAGHFTKIFKSVTGSTPIDYLNMLRLKKARSMLLHTNDNITEIALKCGFSTSSYFSSCFLEKYRTTPTAFRQNFRQEQ